MLDTQPRYDSYKDSGEIWLGQIPSDWNLECIRAVTELKSKRGEPDLPVLSVYRDYGVILKDSRDDNHNATSLDTTNYKVVAPGDLVVNKMKAWQGSMGVSQHEGIVSPAYITCRTDPDKIAPRFLHYTLRSQPFIAVYNSLSYGVRIGQWDMHYDDFKKIPLAFPDLDTQNRIVKFLDEKTSEIDAAVEKKRRLIDLLHEQNAILINRAVTKGLNPDAPMKDSGVDWIGEIPAHWDVKRVKHFAEILPGYAFPSGKFSEVETPVRLLRGINVNPSKVVWDEAVFWPEGEFDAHQRYALQSGDLVMGMDRPWVSSGVRVARISDADLPALLVQRVARIRANDGYSNDFLELLISSKLFLEYFEPILSGVSVPHISDSQIGNFTTAVPDFNEQCAIAEYCRGITSEYGRLMDMEIASINTLNEFKQTLIANAVTGKIKI